MAAVPGSAWLALALLAPPVPLCAAAQREWTQPRGTPEGTSAIDVEPVVAAPVQAWSRSFKRLDSEPIVSGGVVYVVGTQSTGRKLFAFDVQSGESAATPLQLEGSGAASLAAWQGFVAVVDSQGAFTCQHRGTQLGTGKERRIPGRWTSPPCVRDGYLFVCSGTGLLLAVDLRTGRSLTPVPAGYGRPAALPGEKPGEILVATAGCGVPPPPDPDHEYVGTYLCLRRARLTGAGGKTPAIAGHDVEWHGAFTDDARLPSEMSQAWLARVEPPQGGGEPRWFVSTPAELAKQGGGGEHTTILPDRLSPIAGDAVVVGDHVCGFAKDGSLIRFDADGTFAPVIEKDQPLPQGARRGRLTRARGVMYVENWAVDLESGRVLWCDPDLAPSSPLIPAADGRLLYTTASGDLVCLKGSVAPREAAAEVRPTPGYPARATVPGGGAGVVLKDGRHLAGAVKTLEGGRIQVATEGGPAQTFERSEVALVETASGAELVGDPWAVYLAFDRVLLAAWLDEIAARFADWKRVGLLEKCSKLLDEVAALDADGGRAAVLEKQLSGQTARPAANAEAQAERLMRELDEARSKHAGAFAKGAAWCRDRGLPSVAASLLLRAERIRPGHPEVAALGRSVVPRGLPDAGAPAALGRWMLLARAILPVGGRVLDPGDPERALAAKSPFETHALALRTQNLLLFSLEEDPEIVGACLRNGERTVRLLEKLLGDPPRRKKGADDSIPLHVRLHRGRTEYLGETREAGLGRMEWSEGCYSPLENLSRFYVPRDEGSANALDRDLDHVLAHEIVHHYVAQRWLGGSQHGIHGDPLRPGFWIVEGTASFVADQVIEMDRRGERYDDESVRSIDIAARLAEADKLIPVRDLLGMTQQDLGRLPDGPVASVRLRNTIRGLDATAMNVFYEEAASLVFFLMNRAAPETRRAVVDYLAAWHWSEIRDESWKRLGFESAEALESAYRKFLGEAGR